MSEARVLILTLAEIWALLQASSMAVSMGEIDRPALDAGRAQLAGELSAAGL